MFDFEYTKEFTVNSSVIDEVFYNENDNTVVLDVNDTMYRYDGVTQADVAALVNADSVGAYYNTTFKPLFGPSEELGHWSDADSTLVSVDKSQSTPTTSKGLVDNTATKEFSLASLQVESHNVIDASDNFPTKEFSLAAIHASEPVSAPQLQVAEPYTNSEVEDAVEEVVVHFTLKDYDSKFKFNAKSKNVAAAISELDDYLARMDATGKVKKVVVKFDE